MRTLFLVVAILSLTIGAFGQGAAILLDNHGFPVAKSCNGEFPYPDGTPVSIYWDINRNGPDLSDPKVTVCDHPPDCYDGPVGTFNMDHFELNSAEFGLSPGEFLTSPAIAVAGNSDLNGRYYLRTEDGMCAQWYSETFMLNWSVHEIHITSWTCRPSQMIPNDCSSPPGIVAVVISVDSTHVRLNWPSMFGSPELRYYVYSDTLVTGVFNSLLGQTADTTYVDSNAVSSANTRFYVVKYLDTGL